MRIVSIGVLVAIAVAAMALLRPGSSQAPSQGRPVLQVAASIPPLADWLTAVAGNDAEVHCLLSGGNVHNFEPSLRDAERLNDVRAIFAVGLGLDPWARQLSANTGRTDIAFFETGTWITPRLGFIEDHDEHDDEAPSHGGIDPHFWLDPQRGIAVVQRMADELAKIDPDHAQNYRQRAGQYVAELTQVDKELRAAAKLVPSGARLVTFHNAYGYLFDRLGIQTAGAVQLSPGIEPGVKHLSDTQALLKQTGQRIVFNEPGANPAAAAALAESIGAKVEILDPIGTPCSETGANYPARLRHDLRVLLAALPQKDR